LHWYQEWTTLGHPLFGSKKFLANEVEENQEKFGGELG